MYTKGRSFFYWFSTVNGKREKTFSHRESRENEKFPVTKLFDVFCQLLSVESDQRVDFVAEISPRARNERNVRRKNVEKAICLGVCHDVQILMRNCPFTRTTHKKKNEKWRKKKNGKNGIVWFVLITLLIVNKTGKKIFKRFSTTRRRERKETNKIVESFYRWLCLSYLQFDRLMAISPKINIHV